MAYLEPEAYLKPCETLTKHIQNPILGHYLAIFRNIQNRVQRLHIQKPDILEILEYSEPFRNFTPFIFRTLSFYEKLRIFRTLTYLKPNTYQNPLKDLR